MPEIALELPANVDAPARARKALHDIVRGLNAVDRWRGLFIVDQLSDGWGTSDGASRIWFELAARA